MKKKVLHVINSLTTGGAEILLANSLSPGGLQEYTDNYLVYFNKTSYLADTIDQDVKLINLNYTGGVDIIRMLLQLKSIIKTNKIDIVHTHLTPASLYTHLLCPVSVPQVHTIHSTYSMDSETRPVMRYLERKLFLEKPQCNIISLSEFTKEDFLRSISFKGKVFVLNNFVADRYFNLPQKKYDSNKKELRMIAVGSLKELKNFEYLLEVFQQLTGFEIYLDIYGDGDIPKYESVINNNDLKVKMMGHIDDIATVIHQYDLFIMPSKFEGFPLSLFEAMAAGVPLMLSDIGPLRSIVKEHAIYFPLNDAASVAAIMQQIFNNTIDISGMAVKAKAYAEKTVRRDIYIKRLLDIYNQLTPQK
ncbi:MAG: glycosyltransferase family 4 protein [Chitinophagaceae bacterium]|nr:glycosyltransferase family 4 protein [Chitinophagaceae bacterium]